MPISISSFLIKPIEELWTPLLRFHTPQIKPPDAILKLKEDLRIKYNLALLHLEQACDRQRSNYDRNFRQTAHQIEDKVGKYRPIRQPGEP